MALDITQIMTTGDFRRSLISDIAAVRNKELSVPQALAMAAMYKEVNSSLQIEINAAKMAIATEGHAHSFGKVVELGKRLLGGGGKA